MSVVGIDLGTTNTVVACVRSGRVHVISDASGQRLLPSVVSFHPNGEVLVGATAKQRRGTDGKNTISSVKRLIGRSWNSEELTKARARFPFEMREGPGQGPLVVARAQEYTLPEISAFILKRARHIAEAAVNEPVERAVITVPAHFNELQRASTKVAGRVSGLEVLRILNEPTAAALAYGLGAATNERIAVFDFGGGTFDCTLLDLSGNVFEVLASAGDSFLGGDDIDAAIADRMADAFLSQYRSDPREDPQTFERLKLAAEQVKIQLTEQTHTQVTIQDVAYGPGGTHLGFTFAFSRAELDALTEPLVERAFRVTQDALALARLTPTSFDHVILVGGTTRMPVVKRRVEAFFGSAPLDRVNPDEVVAIGAAIQAAALSDQLRRRSIPAPPPVAKKQNTQRGLSERPSVPTFGEGNTLSQTADVPSIQTATGAMPGSSAVITDRMHPGGAPTLPDPTMRDGMPPPKPGTRDWGSDVPPSRTMPLPTRSAPPPSGRPSTAPMGRTPSVAPPPRSSAPVRTAPMPRTSAPPPEYPSNPPPAFGGIDPIDNTAFPDPKDLPTSSPRPGGPIVRRDTPSRGFNAFGAIDDLPSIQSTSGITTPINPFAPTSLRGAGAPPTPVPPTILGPHAGNPSYPGANPSSPSYPASHPGPTNPSYPGSYSGTGNVGNANAGNPSPSYRPSRPSPSHPSNEYASVSVPMPMPPPPQPSRPPYVPSKSFESPQPFANEFHPSPHAQHDAPPALPLPPAVGGYSMPPGVSVGAGAPILVDVTPRALVVETVGGYCDTVIPRNAKIPCERVRQFTTGSDFQTVVRVRVAQGEHKQFLQNTYLGEVELSGIRAAPRGEVRIGVTFELDADGSLRVRATDLQTGQEAAAMLQLIGLATDEPSIISMIDRMARQPISKDFS